VVNIRQEEIENFNKFLKDKSLSIEYKVFKDLKNRNFYVTSGFKYGSDFLVYRDDPNFIHSEYLLYVYTTKQELNLKEIITSERVSLSNRKKYMAACVNIEDDNIIYYTLEWINV